MLPRVPANRSITLRRATALELRSAGGDQGLGPILQVVTDPRFGRMEENFGEDPFHAGKMGVSRKIVSEF